MIPLNAVLLSPARVVPPLDRLVNGELHGAVGYADQRNAQATVEAPYPFGLEDGACASQHRGICALRPAVRRDHAYFENPDRVCQCRGRGSRQRTREKVVAC